MSSSAGRLKHRWSRDRRLGPLLRPVAGIDVTVIIPAYNEAASVGDTIKSLQTQTTPPAAIIVVDDCSTDGTGDLARAFGVVVVRPPTNTGSKAGAQNFGLRSVRTPLTVAVDADTVLARDALECLLPSGEDADGEQPGAEVPADFSDTDPWWASTPAQNDRGFTW